MVDTLDTLPLESNVDAPPLPQTSVDANARKPLPVWDPETESLKAIPFDDALKLQDDGYIVGDAAQQKDLMNSGLAKAAAATGAFANTYTAGAYHALLAATGHEAMLRDEGEAASENRKSALAGTFAGLGASVYKGPLGLGGVPASVLEAVQGVRGLGTLAKVANIGLQGAPAIGTQAALDHYTAEKMLGHPINVEALASSAATDILWGAGLNVATHGLLTAPKMLRSGVGNFLDKLEDWGAVTRNYRAIEEEGAASRVTSHTKIYDVTYPDGVEPGSAEAEPIFTPVRGQLPEGQAGAESAPTFAEAVEGQTGGLTRNGAPTPRPAHLQAMEQSGPFQLPGEIATIPGQDVGFAAKGEEDLHLELPRRSTAEAVPDSRVSGAGAAFRSQPGMPKAEIPAQPIAPEPPSLNPADYEVGFQYDPKSSRANRIATNRLMTLSRLKEVGDHAVEKWDRVRDIAAEYKAIDQTKDFPNKSLKLQELIKEKEGLHKELDVLVPSEIDAAKGVFKPGYSELRSENARLRDKPVASAHSGSYGPKADASDATYAQQLKQYQADLKTYDKAVTKAAAQEAQAAKKVAATEVAAAKRADAAAKLEARQIAQAEAKAQKAAAKQADKVSKLEADQAKRLAKEDLQREVAAAKAERAASAEKDRLLVEQQKAETKAAKAAKREAEQLAAEARKAEPKKRSTETMIGEKINEDGSKELHSQTVTQANGKTRVRRKITIKAPPVDVKYEAGDYEPVFSSTLANGVATAGAYTRNPLLMGVAGFLHGTNALLKVASHRQAIGQSFEKILGGLTKYTAPVIKQGTRAKWIDERGLDKQTRHDEKEYAAAVEAVRSAAADPQAVSDFMQQKYPNVMRQYPEVAQGVTATIHKMAAGLNDLAVKKPYDPPMRDTAFLPPRSRQVAFMRAWHNMANPQRAIENGDLAQMPLLRQVLPNLTAHQREMLQRHIRDSRNTISPGQARQYSAYLGTPVRAIDDAGALKRLQASAGPPPMQASKGGANVSQPSKIATQATQRDAPDADLARF